MNWGHGLTVSFILFAGFMTWLVIGSFKQNIDLVTDEYYQAELQYQDRMDEIQNNTAATQIRVVQSTERIQLEFPIIPEEGAIHLYRPSDSRLDQHFQMEDGEDAKIIDLDGLIKGYYILKMTWTAGGERYYQEKGVFI
ncbi:MAG: FixH family protein [Bacteroidota bacterium]